jgi:hypothetical protein
VSQEHVETVRAILNNWNSGDRAFGRLSEYFDPAIRWESPLSSVAGEPYRGYAGIEQWIRDVDDQFTEWIISVDNTREAGERVIAIGTISALGRASEVTLEFAMAAVAEFASDHRMTRVHIYLDVQEALEAVGLED